MSDTLGLDGETAGARRSAYLTAGADANEVSMEALERAAVAAHFTPSRHPFLKEGASHRHGSFRGKVLSYQRTSSISHRRGSRAVNSIQYKAVISWFIWTVWGADPQGGCNPSNGPDAVDRPPAAWSVLQTIRD